MESNEVQQQQKTQTFSPKKSEKYDLSGQIICQAAD